ncbi:MAG: hypothetical protein Q4A34_02620 [Candidatus Saccharibacteria bacterium]|nr:hypothetical protein [Candidatus Saccharibacteria bacterium]
MKRRVITATLVTLIVLSYVSYIFIARLGRVPVEIISSLEGVSIDLGGKQVNRSSTIFIERGNHQLSVTGDGIGSISRQVAIGGATKIALVLTGETNKRSDSKSLKKIELLSHQQLANEQRKIEQTDPIVKKLPLRNLIYTIGYRADPEREHGVIVEIDAARGYRNGAVYAIEKEGFNPTQYNIRFRQYVNPFQEIQHE